MFMDEKVFFTVLDPWALKRVIVDSGGGAYPPVVTFNVPSKLIAEEGVVFVVRIFP